MIIDITQELLSCNVYPGDPVPTFEKICDIKKGDTYNLSSFSMCTHNGTHIDAPAHFIDGGKRIGQIALEACTGWCYVARAEGKLVKRDVLHILQKAKEADAEKRILLAGDVVVTAEAAQVFADAGIYLLGNESQSVGPEDEPMEVHKILLSAEVILLEGIVLKEVEEGRYFLSAAPINIAEAEGAPCRAYIIRE